MSDYRENIDGTSSDDYQIGKSGPILKKIDSNSLSFRNSEDTDYGIIKIKDPIDLIDGATKKYVDDLYIPIIMRADGKYSVATDLDSYLVIGNRTIKEIKILRQISGSTGSTIVDVNLDGTTIFTNQANRPTVLATSGNNAIDTKIPDIINLLDGQVLTFDIDTIELGNAKNLSVYIVFE